MTIEMLNEIAIFYRQKYKLKHVNRVIASSRHLYSNSALFEIRRNQKFCMKKKSMH